MKVLINIRINTGKLHKTIYPRKEFVTIKQ